MAVVMVSRAPVRWLWRDIRLVYVLLVWAAFATGLFVYFDGSITLRPGARAAPVSPAAQAAKDDAIFTGSIIVVPRSGDDCWKMMLDNRTGRMWESGYVDCNAVAGALADDQRASQSRAVRLHAIGAAFREGR
jgi:hypothetical protein